MTESSVMLTSSSVFCGRWVSTNARDQRLAGAKQGSQLLVRAGELGEEEFDEIGSRAPLPVHLAPHGQTAHFVFSLNACDTVTL